MVAVPCCRSACCLRYCQAYHPPLSVMATVEPGGPGSIGVNRAGAFTRTGMAPTLPHPFGPPTRGLNAARVHGVRRFLARSISIHVTVGIHGVRRVLARRAWLDVRRRVVVRGVDHHPFGVVQRRVTRGTGLTLPEWMMAPDFFRVWCDYGSMRWRGGEAARE